MPGFFISNYKVNVTLENKYANRCVAETLENVEFTIKRNTLDKFMDDKLFSEDEDIIIITEGIFLNKRELSDKKTWFETVKQMALVDEDSYFDIFRGNFAGAHYNKKNRKWIIYADALGIKPVYYYQNGKNWIVASEIHYITDALKSLKVHYTPDVDAAYDILSYGFMTSDTTLVKEIKKLPYGCYITVKDGEFNLSRYFDFNYHEGSCDMTEDEMIERIDEIFKKAVKLAFEKDNEYGYTHIATISGGLDSRMTVWTAAEMGYPMLNITFGQSDCMDEQVAKKVVKYLNMQFMTNTLDNGDMLLAYEPVVRMNDGQSIYSGIAHSYLTLEKLNFERYGLLHTGDIGDAIVGVLANGYEGRYPGAYSLMLADKTKCPWQETENIEKFKMRTRGFLGVGSSKAVCENFTYCVSPFLYRDFFVFCLEKIPYSKRKNHYIYEKWVLAKHSDAAKIPLQRYNGGLMTEGTLLQTFRKIKRIGIGTLLNWILYKVHIKKSLNRKTVKTSMNPVDAWYEEKENIRREMDKCFETGLKLLLSKHLIDSNFKEDLKKLYNNGTAHEKAQAITVVKALEHLFAT